MNFDLGMRRGEVIGSGEEARKGAGEDMLSSFRAFRYVRDDVELVLSF